MPPLRLSLHSCHHVAISGVLPVRVLPVRVLNISFVLVFDGVFSAGGWRLLTLS